MSKRSSLRIAEYKKTRRTERVSFIPILGNFSIKTIEVIIKID